MKLKLNNERVLALIFACAIVVTYGIQYLSGFLPDYPYVVPLCGIVLGIALVYHKNKYTTFGGILLIGIDVVLLMISYGYA